MWMNEFRDFVWLFIYSVRMSLICCHFGLVFFFFPSFFPFSLAPSAQTLASVCMTLTMLWATRSLLDQRIHPSPKHGLAKAVVLSYKQQQPPQKTEFLPVSWLHLPAHPSAHPGVTQCSQVYISYTKPLLQVQ